MTDKTYIFLHIPKTAGTTLHQVMARQYRASQFYTVPSTNDGVAVFKQLPESRRATMRMVKGHFDFGLHTHLPNPTAYLTVLRDPVARLRSYYHFIRRIPEHYCHELVVGQDLSLTDCLEQGIDVMMDNGQTRMIAGQLYQHPFGQCPEVLLTLAKAHLRQHFAVVGVMERFDETLLLMKHQLGWRHVYYAQRNVAPKQAQRGVETAVRSLIEEVNWMDVALHRFANALLDEQIEQAGAGFKAEYEAFKVRNQRVGPLVHVYDELTQRTVRENVRLLRRRLSFLGK